MTAVQLVLTCEQLDKIGTELSPHPHNMKEETAKSLVYWPNPQNTCLLHSIVNYVCECHVIIIKCWTHCKPPMTRNIPQYPCNRHKDTRLHIVLPT